MKCSIISISKVGYIPYTFITEKIPTLVIAESEYKAMASGMLGVPAVGVPGIASFSRKHFDRLLQIVNALAPDNVSVCFDNEVKDNSSLPNYKPDKPLEV